jgi:hypothetical protein
MEYRPGVRRKSPTTHQPRWAAIYRVVFLDKKGSQENLHEYVHEIPYGGFHETCPVGGMKEGDPGLYSVDVRADKTIKVDNRADIELT